MFQPFNESYIRSTVESTIDRHTGENEETRALREDKSYQPGNRLARVRESLKALGLTLFGTHAHPKDLGPRRAPLAHPRGVTH